MDKKDTAQKISDTARQAEGAIDDVVGKATAKVDEVIPEHAKNTAKDVVKKAHEFAGKVDQFTWKIDDFADDVLPEQTGTDIEIQPQRNQSVSRLFIFRCLWMIIQYPIIMVRGFVIFFAIIINRIYMLIMGMRSRYLRNSIVRFYLHNIKRASYVSGITDKRPEIIEK